MSNHHITHRPVDHLPTDRQLAYIRRLAIERGVTFIPPCTRSQASRIIDELRALPRDADADVRRETKAVIHDLAQPRGADIRDNEITGHGSTATWKDRS